MSLLAQTFQIISLNLKRLVKDIKELFKEGFVLDYPLEIIHKNGHKTPVLYNASVYKDEFGKL